MNLLLLDKATRDTELVAKKLGHAAPLPLPKGGRFESIVGSLLVPLFERSHELLLQRHRNVQA